MDAPLVVGTLTVFGTLVWNDVTQVDDVAWLCAGFVAVNGGQFQMHITSKNSFIYIKNTGIVENTLRMRGFGGYNNATVSIEGRQMARTWSVLAATVQQGESSISLLHNPQAMGWQLGT